MIRQINEQDIDNVMAIWLESNKKAHYFIPETYWNKNYSTIRTMIKNSEVFVYQDGEKLIGFVGVMSNYIAGLFVKEGYHSIGIGKALVDYLKTNKGELELYVYAKNTKALDFYLAQKFKKIEEKLDEYHNEIEYRMVWKKEN